VHPPQAGGEEVQQQQQEEEDHYLSTMSEFHLIFFVLITVSFHFYLITAPHYILFPVASGAIEGRGGSAAEARAVGGGAFNALYQGELHLNFFVLIISFLHNHRPSLYSLPRSIRRLSGESGGSAAEARTVPGKPASF
jgi:hypothetical protein